MRLRRHLAGLDASDDLELLVRASGKMVLLDKLLPKLRAEGRQVGLPAAARGAGAADPPARCCCCCPW
jgi:hypothetical protein